ncbi:putative multidrug efflux pump [Escherichia coli]|uniref:Putative multidrug efflux pump n=1 Tax=Escherichia coli TaxID=562 RepID=A0A377DNU4_ECOLX|nr:putative multidrug efflux pump [Escherichia coli]
MATAELVLNRLDELAQYFPHGLEYKVAYETTSFVKASIEDVVKTLLEAIALVFLVMYLFLQNFRATLIPTIAVPVVLMGNLLRTLRLRLQRQHLNHVRDGAGDRSAGG